MAFELGPFLIQFLVILGGAAIFRRLALRVGQPPVVGEIFLGFLLGASVLAVFLPNLSDLFFPIGNRPLFEALGWIGLILFIYNIGAELHWDAREAWPIFFIAAGGLIVPFVLGTIISLAQPGWFFPGSPNINNVILMGCIMSISALAVLGRLLADMNMMASRAASLSLGASTIDDIVAWILVALVAGSGEIGLVGNINLNLLIVAVLFGIALLLDRYLSPRAADHAGRNNPRFLVVLVFGIFLSALITHEAGLHALLGAFAVGGIISRHPTIREYASSRLREMTSILFLPAFFVLMGMNVDLTVLDFPEALWALLILVLVASVSKIVGVYVGGRATGVDSFTSLQVGILLNNRGAVDLVVAKVGYDAGLLSQGGFSLVVMMITMTTLLSPVSMGLLERFTGRKRAEPFALVRRETDL